MGTSPNRVLGIIFGLVFVGTGVLGFSATAGVGIFDTTGGRLLDIFEVNVAQNVLHLLAGTALLIAGLASARRSKIINLGIGALFVLIGLAGFFLAGGPANVLAVNLPSSLLHVVAGAVLLAIGIAADRVTRESLRQLPPPVASDRVSA
jgi:hypothetical protein